MDVYNQVELGSTYPLYKSTTDLECFHATLYTINCIHTFYCIPFYRFLYCCTHNYFMETDGLYSLLGSKQHQIACGDNIHKLYLLSFFHSISMTFSHRLLVWSLGFGSLWYPGFLLFSGKNSNKKQGAA